MVIYILQGEYQTTKALERQKEGLAEKKISKGFYKPEIYCIRWS
jgi:hypothetical protein